MSDAPAAARRDWLSWALVALGAGGALVVVWVLASEGGGVVHGHPAYALWLAVTAVASVVTTLVGLQPTASRRRTWWVVGILALILGIAWLALTAWLRPHTAVEPALAAMRSDADVEVTESATRIVMSPAGGGDETAVFFQPGALVDARAYAAVLRPLADAGHPVVIAKQPLGIAFLAITAFDDARASADPTTDWIVGGHSLGGTVAALEADAADADAAARAVGLMLYASYPASDISASLDAAVISISGSQDGLSTPAAIAASRENLPADAEFVQIEGASHAQFGAYGPQTGDGTPTISDDAARAEISAASLDFVARVG